ncbi:GerMN domain-containing protein [Paenibacillus dakarensis]|uniref:GerMN domain-containing protein n=1 Tax=Paenibacillus dakarensis TaxID=1527293 RepID=UPI0006D5806C|nr:GerMN domain-containing protein [Paenibacillus dakarensis]
MNRKLWSIGLLAALMVFSAGCGQKPEAAPGNTPEQNAPAGSSNASGENNVPSNEESENEKKTETIGVYYTDQEMLELKKGSAEITFQDDNEKYSEAFKALKSSDNEELLPLWELADLNSSVMDNGKLTLDLHIPAEARFGAGGEMFAVDALKNTFFQFEEVKSLQLLVDGEQVDSLMGHVELKNPETR